MGSEKILKNATLAFPIREAGNGLEILLARKMKKIAAGFWNGYGGGIKKVDITTFHSVRRELLEEGRIIAPLSALRKMAIIDFHNTTSEGAKFTCRVHVFLLSAWEGEPKSTPEMRNPTWFKEDSVPYDGMAPSDGKWLPKILRGNRFFAEAHLGPHQRELIGDVVFREIEPEEMYMFEKGY